MSFDISEIVKELSEQRAKILDDFAKTYLAANTSGNDVEYLINNLELVETIGKGDVYRTYHYRLREENSEYMKEYINEF